MSESTILDFYSTFAQSIAALVGLSATFAVYYYQTMQASVVEKSEKIHGAFDGDYFEFMLSPDQARTIFRVVNHVHRAVHLEPVYEEWISDRKERELAEALRGDVRHIERFKSWKE